MGGMLNPPRSLFFEVATALSLVTEAAMCGILNLPEKVLLELLRIAPAFPFSAETNAVLDGTLNSLVSFPLVGVVFCFVVTVAILFATDVMLAEFSLPALQPTSRSGEFFKWDSSSDGKRQKVPEFFALSSSTRKDFKSIGLFVCVGD